MLAGLGIALVGAHGVDRAVLFDEGQGVERLGAGGDELGGEAGLLGVGRQQGGGLGDGGVVAADEVFGGVGDRRRERGAEAVGKLVVHVPRELDGEVGVLEALHARNVYLVRVACVKSYLHVQVEPGAAHTGASFGAALGLEAIIALPAASSSGGELGPTLSAIRSAWAFSQAGRLAPLS